MSEQAGKPKDKALDDAVYSVDSVPGAVIWFPIHPCDRDKLAAVPWGMVAHHEVQARHNHSQTLSRLAERGGLSLCELYAVLLDRDYERVPTHEALSYIISRPLRPMLE